MAAAAQPDSLEGWVAVRQAAFAEPEPGALRFLVGWNAAEAQFAVTCHSRAGRGGPGPAEVAAAERSWVGLFSARALLGVHRQLAALSAGLESCFPPLPPALLEGRARGLWALLFSAGPAEEEAAALDELCRRLECYLALALDLCGRRLVLDALFARDPDSAYCEPLAELRRAALQARLAAATQALRTVLQRHKNADTMVALMKVYEEEDEAYWDLVTMATQFYQYLLQPFRDMRELATLYKLEILKSLQFDNLGPKRIEDLQKEAAKWTKQAAEAVCSIQDITVNYFKETVKALTAMNKQMEQDQLRFGQASWASASPRQENLKYMLAKETLQHRRAKELCLKQKRAGIRKKMENLEEQQKNIAVVEELEIEYYETQLKLYNIQLEILKHEEMLLIAQLETLRRQIKEKQDEVVYYDTCENPEELQVTEQKMGPHYVQSSEVTKLRLKTQQLETKRGTICARRAYLRNKKEQCEESHQLRLQEAQESIKRYQQHHSIQIKRETKKEEEKKKKAWISQERQKTLERLKTFKEKCPAQLVLKTPPSQLRNTKHPQGVSHEIPALSPQPMSIISLAPQQSSSTQLAPGSGLKMPCQNIPADTPVQVFDFTDDPKYSEGLMMMPPPPPPPPPLPLHLKAPATIKEQPLPLICEDFTAGPATQRRADLPKCSVNDCTGTMDKVLASLRHGEVFLRRVEKPNSSPSDASIKDSILLAIRQGVKLRKVNRDPEKVVRESSNELERSIKAAIQRIKKVSADSEEDENGDQNSREWDS